MYAVDPMASSPRASSNFTLALFLEFLGWEEDREVLTEADDNGEVEVEVGLEKEEEEEGDGKEED